MEIKMSRFDNSPWGFRVHGGIDFGAPLRIQKVSTILAFLCAIKALALASRAYLVLYMYPAVNDGNGKYPLGRPLGVFPASVGAFHLERPLKLKLEGSVQTKCLHKRWKDPQGHIIDSS